MLMKKVLADAEPAGGAPIEDVIVASLVGVVLLVLALAFGYLHRSGKTRVLERLGRFSERVSGLPPWAALPAAVAGSSLIVAAFGFYWDVATHIDNGRDPGPFANPAHFLIIFGLLGIAAAGYLGVLLGTEEQTASSVPIRGPWRAPVGAVLLLVCGVVAVAGFPLDDMWHRLFGQDVTLWGPTHIQMVGGASLSTLAFWILLVEGRRAKADAPAEDPSSGRKLLRGTEALVAGAFLIGLSTFQGEFDYSVPQFRLLFHPVLLMLAASIALVPARIRLGRGGALKAVFFFLALRGGLSLVIGPVLGHTTLHFPLYLAEALAVELVALRVSTDRQVSFGAWAGAAIALLGLPGEWLWSHLWMTMSWPLELLPEAVIAGTAAALAGGVLGGLIGRAMTDPGTVVEWVPKRFAAFAAIVVVVCLTFPLPITRRIDESARVRLLDGTSASSRLEVELDPDVARDSEWFNVTAWQGGGSVVADLVPAGDGVYRTESEVPVSGEWKTLIRLHDGSDIVAVPVYLPRDAAIGAPEVPALESFSRPFVADKEILLREALPTEPWVSWLANAVLAIVILVWVGALAWGLTRLRNERSGGRATSPSERSVSLARG